MSAQDMKRYRFTGDGPVPHIGGADINMVDEGIYECNRPLPAHCFEPLDGPSKSSKKGKKKEAKAEAPAKEPEAENNQEGD